MSDSRDHHDAVGAVESSAASRSTFGGVVLGIVAGLASQTVVLTAVLFYFGWARSRATYAYFGVDISTLNFSVSDYVLRSVNTAFPLLMAIGFLALGAIIVHDQLRPRLTDNSALATRLVRILTGTGCGLVAAGFVLAVVITGPGGLTPAGPAAMVVGFAVAAYALMLRDHYVEGTRSRLLVAERGGRNVRSRVADRTGRSRLLIAVLSLAFLALLWTVEVYANYIGIKVAEQVRASLPSAPNVTVYSASDLSLAGPGLTVSRMIAPGAQYRFRVSGLRLLVNSGSQDFLLPAGWRPGTGPVIVLPVTPSGQSTRIEYSLPSP